MKFKKVVKRLNADFSIILSVVDCIVFIILFGISVWLIERVYFYWFYEVGCASDSIENAYVGLKLAAASFITFMVLESGHYFIGRLIYFLLLGLALLVRIGLKVSKDEDSSEVSIIDRKITVG